MKKVIRIAAIAFLFVFSIGCFSCVAQETDRYKIISDKVANKDFIFSATSLSPMNGKTRTLTDPYEVRVKKDSVISYLPYFGRVQTAPVNPDDAGVNFTSTRFDYKVNAGKKSSWEVNIKFKDQMNTQEFNFTIYDDGSALLNVSSLLRDPISYRGDIKLK